jgi:hypothetical protein
MIIYQKSKDTASLLEKMSMIGRKKRKRKRKLKKIGDIIDVWDSPPFADGETNRLLREEEITKEGIRYVDNMSGRRLAKPPVWGERRDIDGDLYHVGNFNPFYPGGPTILYHWSDS